MKTTSSKKQVRETNAGKSISAYVIINPNGEHVATVQAAFLDSGNVRVDVWGKYELIHQGKAGGYGYDKFTAALSGAIIDGVKIFDHCGTDDKTERILSEYQAQGYEDDFIKAEIKAIGARFANWKPGNDVTSNGYYTSLYYESGLQRLTEMGYNVIKAI